MSSASAIPPSHVPSAVLLRQIPSTTEDEEWPALSPSRSSSRPTFQASEAMVDNDWELLTEASAPATTTTTTNSSPTVVRIVEPPLEAKVSFASIKNNNNDKNNPRSLKHCQSSPDLRHFVLEDSSSCSSSSSSSSSDDESSAVLIDEHDLTSLASSSVVMVPSPWAASSPSKPSFRDTLLKQQQQHTAVAEDEIQPTAQQHHRHHHHHHHGRSSRKLEKPKFVVSKPSIRRCAKSTGDLQGLGRITEDDTDEEGEVLGETDAELYYNQKAQGKLGRVNGRKQRPDEAKRLEITMAKKTMQRERTVAAGCR